MANLISNKDGQLMLLTAFMIIIGVVFYTTILNGMVFSSNMPSTGVDVSKQDIREIKENTESEIKAALISNLSNIAGINLSNQTEVRAYFINYINSYSDSLKTMYSAQGVSVDIIFNNISFNKTNQSIIASRYFVEKKKHNFTQESLVIPMDGNQSNVMAVYGFIYDLVDNSGTDPLNSTRIPVWLLLQNAVNNSVQDFYTQLYTDNNPSTAIDGTIKFRNYSGGPFLIDVANFSDPDTGSINETLKQLILNEAANKGITVHELKLNFTYNKSVVLLMPPKVAIYPMNDAMTRNVMRPYYKDGSVPYTEVSNTDILNGNLTKSNFDILTIPHHDMTGEPQNVTREIVGWVANGGILHIECAGIDSMDDAVESNPYTKNAKPWYGLMGISKSDSSKIPDTARYMKLLDNSTRFNVSPYSAYSFNMSPPMNLSGLADPGAPYDPLAQADNKSGIFGPEIDSNGNYFDAATTAFSMRRNASQINPGTNILAYSSYANGTPLYVDANGDGVKEPQLLFAEAPYDNGLVIYVAGHNLTMRSGNAERLIFESFFTASLRRQDATIVAAQNINITIRYFDGKVNYEDTFTITI